MSGPRCVIAGCLREAVSRCPADDTSYCAGHLSHHLLYQCRAHVPLPGPTDSEPAKGNGAGALCGVPGTWRGRSVRCRRRSPSHLGPHFWFNKGRGHVTIVWNAPGARARAA